jgi:dienelactone hydrolase
MKIVASSTLTLMALASVAIITGCGGGNASSITPLSITVSVTASVNPIEANSQSLVTAMLAGDTSGKGVMWTVSCSAAQCGTIASNPSPAPNNYPATYTSPTAPPPSDLVVTIKATSVADASKSGATTITISAITVSLTQTTATLQAGGNNTVTIGANVNNDPSGQGVTWSITPASGGGTLSSQGIFGVTYNAPTTPPANDLQVTVTATSIEDSSKTAVVTITIPSVVITVTPAMASVEATGTVSNIVATLNNDVKGQGVTWTISCSTQPCGSIAPGSTMSGNATTYTAPPTPPASDVPVTVTATSVADPAAQTSITITVNAILVTVTSATGTVQFGQAVPNIVATVQFDPANKGVTWAIQPCGQADCGSISPSATASGQAITYTAPANPPASNLGIQIVATSDSDPNQQVSLTITVLAITVVVSPSSGFIPVGATSALNATPFTVAVNNDTSGQGATWTLTQNSTACSPTCGTISVASTGACTPNCAPTTYAAPSSVPANNQVTLTATSVEDTTKSNSATITLTLGTVKLLPAALNFGRLKITSTSHPTKRLTETLTNTGGSALNITGQSVSSGPFSVTAPCQGSTATSVASGASCDITVTFAPLTSGGFNAKLTITDNDATSPQLVPVSGSACSGFNCRIASDIRTAVASNPTPTTPAPTGPFSVGTRTLDLIDQTRSDPYLNNRSKRELLVRFWYPAVVSHGCQPAQYASPGVWNYFAELERVAAPAVKTNSCQDAPMADGRHPVVVFTHGYTGTFTDYTFLFEDFASRGYVVASVNHTFEATAAEFPDGRLIKSVIGSHFGNTTQLDAKATSFAVAVRMADLKFVVDELQRMNAARAGQFAKKLDLSRLALAGHSLGGLTALLGMEMEPRFRAAVDLDGVTPGPLFGTTDKPVLMLFSGRDPWDHDTCHLWGQLHGARLGLSFKGSDHLTPSDAVWLANGAVQTGTVGMEKTVEAIRNFVAAFLDSNVRGIAAGPLLRGASSEYPDVEVTTRGDSPCGQAKNASGR